MILYFIVLLLLWISATGKNRLKTDVNCLRIALILMFFIFVLRDFSVGRDIAGYKEAYELTQDYPFWYFDYVYFENGYLLLCKLFNYLHLSFRVFFIFIYALILVPLYYFLKNHSKDPLFSLIIYYCYQFFVLDMSGLRQSIAMSVCLMAYMVLMSEKRQKLLYFALIVFAAFSIHRSAIIFSFVAFFVLKKETLTVNLLLVAAYLAIILFLMQYDKFILLALQDEEMTQYGFDSNLQASSTFILNLWWLIFMFVAYSSHRLNKQYMNLLTKYLHLMACACVTMFALQGSPLLRASSYYLLFLLIALPEFLSQFLSRSSLAFIKFLIIGLYFYIFYSTVLEPSQFDIVPYNFAF